MNGVVRGILIAVGVLVVLCSGAVCITAIVEFASGGDGKTSPGVYAGLIVLFGGGAVAGALLIWWMARSSFGGSAPQPGPSIGYATVGQAPSANQGADAEQEQRILQFAEQERGRVTVAEVAAHCQVTVAQAKADLDRMVMQQVAQLLVTDKGVLVYVFPGFLSDDEKANAKDI